MIGIDKKLGWWYDDGRVAIMADGDDEAIEESAEYIVKNEDG